MPGSLAEELKRILALQQAKGTRYVCSSSPYRSSACNVRPCSSHRRIRSCNRLCNRNRNRLCSHHRRK